MKEENEEKREINSKVFGPLITERGFYQNMTREVGLHIKNKDFYNWEEIKDTLKDKSKYNVNINSDGAIFLVLIVRDVLRTFEPICKELGYDLDKVRAEHKKLLNIYRKSVDIKEIKKINEMKNEIGKNIDEKLSTQLKPLSQ